MPVHQRHTMRGMVTIVALLSVVLRQPPTPADAGEMRIERDDATVSLLDGKRVVLRYRYRGVPMKPYADQLFSPAGVQVVRDSPHDHKHHHGMMFRPGHPIRAVDGSRRAIL